jgi:hypothetical protein
MTIYPRVSVVAVVGDYQLMIEFRDGSAGTVDLSTFVASSGGVFVSLRDARKFAEVRVDADAGTLTWPNGADIDPDVLYTMVHGPDATSPA